MCTTFVVSIKLASFLKFMWDCSNLESRDRVAIVYILSPVGFYNCVYGDLKEKYGKL